MAGTDRFLDGILERNRAFVGGRSPRPLPPVEIPPLAVVACYDPRLDELVLPSIGLAPGEAFLLRTAGAVVPPDGDPMRSLAMAIFLFGVREVLIVGHSSCRMASFSNAAFIEAFRRRGVARDAFGDHDLRTWAGAISDPRRGVLASVSNVVDAPFVPRDVGVAGAVLDDTTGALEIVVRPGERPGTGLALEAPLPGAPPAEPALAAAAQPPAAAAADTTPAEDDPLVHAVARLVEAVQSRGQWRAEVEQLRRELSAVHGPLAKAGLLEKYVRRAASESHEVAQAFDHVKREVRGAHGRPDPGELAEIFLRLAGKAGPRG